ncbi:MAG: recombinase family protein [Verrucomicrobiales bacterium]|nr:recombinase family protein [Verrucomicrobiales bacterium]
MIFGYARVSTTDQNPDLQFDALSQAGYDRIFTDKASGAKADRPQYCKLLDQVRPGDTILIWKLDRLGRSLRHLLDVVDFLNERHVGLKSLTDPIDTTTSQGKLIFNIFACLAEFERDLISERTKAGLAAARARGRIGGRPKGLSPEGKRNAIAAASLFREGNHTILEICQALNISRSTFYRYLRYERKRLKEEVKATEND